MAQDPSEVTHPGETAGAIAPADSPSPTTAQIRSDIENTRAEMSETIDAIQERLSPSRLVTQAKENIKEATVGRVKSLTQQVRRPSSPFDAVSSLASRGILQSVTDNPMPVVLLGIATAGIVMRAFRRSQTEAYPQARAKDNNANRARRVRNNAQFLVAAGAGAVCWVIWKAQSGKPGFPATVADDDSYSVEATRPSAAFGIESSNGTL
jgi:Protein of unknown function (DUF3618)